MGVTDQLSIVIPCRDAAAHLGATLAALESLCQQGAEVILVDDGSLDVTQQIMRAWAGQHERARVLQQDRLGLSAARNHGLAHASGAYVQFLDSDDVPSPDGIRAILEVLVRTQAPVARGRHVQHHHTQPAALPASRVRWRWVSGATGLKRAFPAALRFIFRRDFLEHHGIRFPEGVPFAEDVPFALQVANIVDRYPEVDAYPFSYRVGHPHQMTSSSQVDNWAKLATSLQAAHLVAQDCTEPVRSSYAAWLIINDFRGLPTLNATARNVARPAFRAHSASARSSLRLTRRDLGSALAQTLMLRVSDRLSLPVMYPHG
jgi:glycosyltransferase involved in cell wall biosynthesis